MLLFSFIEIFSIYLFISYSYDKLCYTSILLFIVIQCVTLIYYYLELFSIYQFKERKREKKEKCILHFLFYGTKNLGGAYSHNLVCCSHTQEVKFCTQYVPCSRTSNAHHIFITFLEQVLNNSFNLFKLFSELLHFFCLLF